MIRARLAGSVCLAAAVLLAASAAPAATINEVLNQDWDPVTNNPLGSFGSSAYFLTYNNLGAGPSFLGGGRPTPGTGVNSNPSELSFSFAEGGVTGGGGAGGGGAAPTGPTSSIYTLGNNLGGSWSMIFSVLFFDPDFNGAGLGVEVLGSQGGIKEATLTPEDVQEGQMLSWEISAEAGEVVQVVVSPFGDQTFAAGFFMDEASFAIPEPATLALVGVGALALIRRRRK